MRTEAGGSRRDHLRALAQRVEVDAKDARIIVESALLRAFVAGSSAKTSVFECRFCTEVAHPTRFERVTSTFEEWRSLKLS
jgi:hypothetical protein